MTTEPLRVLHILTDTNIGGAGTLLCNLLAAADPTAVSYRVLLPEGSRLAPRLEALRCPVTFLPIAGDTSFSPAALFTLRRAICRVQPDIVHTHAALSARLAARLVGPGSPKPLLVTTRHCTFPLKPYQKTALARGAFRAGSRLLADGVIAVAEAAKENLVALGMEPGRVRVIVNGTSPLRVCSPAEREAAAERYGVLPGDFVVGMPARLERYKGQETVLHAARLCREKNPHIRFFFWGNGSCRTEYERLAAELQLGRNAVFCGFAEDMASVFSLMQVNLNASVDTETASLSLSEGMSLGIPAVASRSGGNPYMVRPGENGELFPPGDAPALATVLLALADNPPLLASLGKGARRRFETELNAARMARETEAFYRELAERKAKPRPAVRDDCTNLRQNMPASHQSSAE